MTIDTATRRDGFIGQRGSSRRGLPILGKVTALHRTAPMTPSDRFPGRAPLRSVTQVVRRADRYVLSRWMRHEAR
jgi:hypothetical protein